MSTPRPIYLAPPFMFLAPEQTVDINPKDFIHTNGILTNYCNHTLNLAHVREVRTIDVVLTPHPTEEFPEAEPETYYLIEWQMWESENAFAHQWIFDTRSERDSVYNILPLLHTGAPQ